MEVQKPWCAAGSATAQRVITSFGASSGPVGAKLSSDPQANSAFSSQGFGGFDLSKFNLGGFKGAGQTQTQSQTQTQTPVQTPVKTPTQPQLQIQIPVQTPSSPQTTQSQPQTVSTPVRPMILPNFKESSASVDLAHLSKK